MDKDIKELISNTKDNPLMREINRLTGENNRLQSMTSQRGQLMAAMLLDGIEAIIEDAKNGNPVAHQIIARFKSQLDIVLETHVKPRIIS